MQLGTYTLKNALFVAPMAGVTDRPFRQLCKRLGAGLAVSEMTSANSALWSTRKSRRRADHEGEAHPVSVQIAGGDAKSLAEAARHNVDQGAQIIDINMGCPAKKVCNLAAGSALLRDERLVGEILDAVVQAVGVPVTLKIRTGWDRASRNAVRVAHMAESAGICMLAIHGRTRADLYNGEAEYETVAEVKSRVRIQVIANGNIDSPQKALQVLESTGSDALIIGRDAQGRPWIFREIEHFLQTGKELPSPTPAELRSVLVHHLHELYAFYGETGGVRVARKHIGWYTRSLPGGADFRSRMNRLETPEEQCAAVEEYLDGLAGTHGPVASIGELAA